MSFLFGPLEASIVLISSGIINIFVNFIPSIILGAPEDGKVLKSKCCGLVYDYTHTA